MPVVNFLVIFSFIFLLTGCDPDEPKVDFCVVIDAERLHCFPHDKEKPEYNKLISECLGCQVVTAKEFGEMKKHHKELHIELDSCEF